MDREIYHKNLNAIGNYIDTWKEFIEQRKYQLQDNIEICEEKAYDGEKIFAIRKDDRRLYLSGKYGPSKTAHKWIKQQNCDNFGAVIFLVGIGDAVLLKHLMEELTEEVYIIVYEPCINIFIKALEEVDISSAFESKRVAFIVDGINDDELSKAIRLMITVENMTMVHVAVTGNYEVLFADKVKSAIKELKEYLTQLRVDINTRVEFTDVSGINTIKNIKYLYDCYTMNALYQLLPKEYPCIVVAAGPSLDKNIDDLKDVQDKACIIACDTALKPLLNHGIKPDFFLVVDPRKPEKLFDHPEVKNIPFVACVNIPNDIMKKHTGKKFFYATEEKLLEETVMIGLSDKNFPVNIKEGMSYLPTGGSVATSAFSLAQYLGSKKIILVGQDLAMTNNKTHADGTFKDKMDKIDFSKGNYIKVEGIDGQDVYTIGNLELYLKWFEKQIRECPDVEVIDATEGGALIHGSTVMTLKDAIQEKCALNIDVQKCLDELPKFLNTLEKQKVLEYFINMEQALDEATEIIKEGEKCYEQLLSVNVCNSNKISKLMKKIKKINKKLEDNTLCIVSASCLEAVQATIRITAYQFNEDKENEIRSIGHEGITYLNKMNIVLEGLKPIIQSEIIDFAKKKKENEVEG